MKAATCLLAAAASAATLPEPPPSPDVGRAFVTIPSSELRALWEAGQRKPEPVAPPVPFIVHCAEVRIALGETAGKIDAEFEVEALDKKWQRIPLLGGDVRLDKAEAGDRTIALRKDFCRAERPAVALFYQRRSLEK